MLRLAVFCQYSSEISVHYQKSTRPNPEDIHLHTHHHVNLISLFFRMRDSRFHGGKDIGVCLSDVKQCGFVG